MNNKTNGVGIGGFVDIGDGESVNISTIRRVELRNDKLLLVFASGDLELEGASVGYMLSKLDGQPEFFRRETPQGLKGYINLSCVEMILNNKEGVRLYWTGVTPELLRLAGDEATALRQHMSRHIKAMPVVKAPAVVTRPVKIASKPVKTVSKLATRVQRPVGRKRKKSAG